MKKFIFKLYITGYTEVSKQAIENIRRIGEEKLPGNYELAIIDILQNQSLVKENEILVTPTLVKELPKPSVRIVGNLSDKNKILEELGLEPHTNIGVY